MLPIDGYPVTVKCRTRRCLCLLFLSVATSGPTSTDYMLRSYQGLYVSADDHVEFDKMDVEKRGLLTQEQFTRWWQSTGNFHELPPDRQATFNQAVSYFQVGATRACK